ncbi:hypothetical protein SASPL_102936 [Salvia splendens]|uniref:Disease resistance R13L4/SHOC-2-like LRR domain-containing protein n=1 Tax=Salvia splendens TaxID=180675 RepID=A0A8X8YY64_SALSN|nr:hypothetical protein SASPL_102936 [Salvia splendens]
MFKLIYFTYLASYIPNDIVLPAIAKLQNLQTLIIYRSNVRLPVEIWSLRQLRHLIAFSFCPLLLPEGTTLSLENLHTLYMATNLACSGRMVRMIPNIKKLGICYSEEKFSACYSLENLIHLLRLEKLKLEVHSSFVPHLDNLVFPRSLIKLKFSFRSVSCNYMMMVGSFPNLQMLKLKNYACYAEQWETIEGEFRKEFVKVARCRALMRYGIHESCKSFDKVVYQIFHLRKRQRIKGAMVGDVCLTVDSLQQTLLLILQRHDDLITPPVKQQIISIHDKAAGLQLNLKHFPDKETIREVANTAKRIIEYLFSPLNLSDFGFIHPTVRLPNQLGELARELDSTVGYVVDYCKINSNSVSDSPGVSSSSRSALKSQVDHLTIAKELIVRDSNKSRLLGGRIKSAPSPVITRFSLKSPVELIAINTYRLKRLEEKIKSTAKELADDTIGPSYSIPISLPTNKDVFAGFDDDLNDSAAVASSSRPAPKRAEDPSDTPSIYPSTTKYDVVGFDEDCLEDLIKQSLVLISSRKTDGKIKSCRLHSMVRDFCVRQAGQEKNDRSYWELGQVFELSNLTYLASNIPDSIVPPAIAKLQNLQTLIIYRSDVRLPVEIWSLRMLRHLIAFSFQPLPLPKRATLSLKNLQTLSMAIDFVCSEKVVEMIPNIKKLGICYSQEKFGSGYYCLDNLIRFRRVEKLKLEMHSLYVPRLIVFPLSLKKLELSGGWISWRDMMIVGSLPNLQVLKLKNYACHGEHWETIEGEFGNLILLLIDESTLKHWKTSGSHFPSLQCLMLHRCPYLDEIPHDFGNIPTLKLIEIDDHNQSLLYSANKIKAKHRNDRLKVVVKRS